MFLKKDIVKELTAHWGVNRKSTWRSVTTKKSTRMIGFRTLYVFANVKGTLLRLTLQSVVESFTITLVSLG